MDTHFVNEEDIIYEEDLNMEVTLFVSRYIIKKQAIYYIVINCYIV